ncbi:Cytochrome P450 CYP58S1 [Metarhizium robertsii ARSEF 23]|uniref:Cytochrome P450 CYP58S1 n=1 Tax=Metarhizium robertsii (strain ARSEF 23 / ATCC MYA-3075) TaxID=655844 RepID=E9FB65_METRA|nr:Cytochrome P450 CYP58S1 [Metarhizium robertsii ARSEF 23]EFY95065.2 Cytochrome P450 CYP58S1 [Metarhizium robertsii ARSEF 23]
MIHDVLRLWVVVIILASWLGLKSAYRLSFHRLAGFPGPKLTACTQLYEFFYNVVRPGKFLFKIEEMHQQYGPLVRINPREVHVRDPSFYDEIYASSRRTRDKDAKFVPTYALPDSMVATQFGEFERNQSVLCLDDAFAALPSDIITSYCCGKHGGFLEDQHFRNDIRRATADAMEFGHICRFCPWLVYALRLLPPRVISNLMPGKAAVFKFLASLLDDPTTATHEKTPPIPTTGSQPARKTMVAALADPSIPLRERSYNRLQDETFAIIAAGTETTARVLTVAAYHLARDGDLRDTLRAELKRVMPTLDARPTWPELEKLPYLTPISSSSYILHRDASIFPDPERFDPERWVKAAQNGDNLKKYLTSFTRGSRACIGINLAYMELFLTVAHLLRRFDMELYDTEEEDVRIVRDMNMGYTRRGNLRVYAKLSLAEG